MGVEVTEGCDDDEEAEDDELDGAEEEEGRTAELVGLL
jgi:hypothetical protein